MTPPTCRICAHRRDWYLRPGEPLSWCPKRQWLNFVFDDRMLCSSWSGFGSKPKHYVRP
jgi:hypothetical protein